MLFLLLQGPALIQTIAAKDFAEAINVSRVKTAFDLRLYFAALLVPYRYM